MKFTILLVNYNPIWKKVKFTLDTILAQTFTDYEIVITDDGSEDNQFDQIENYLKDKGFHDYKLVPHVKNQGTVKNLIDGVEASSGKYVRDFGPGDGFYNAGTLQALYDFMEENEALACFGLMRGYSETDDGQILYTEFNHPFDIEAYRLNDRERILKNLVIYRDNASGAVTCYQRDYFLKYLKMLEGTVRYVEDIFQILAELNGEGLYFFPEYMVWYESDAGVSTKKRSSFSEHLAVDVDHFYEMLQQEYGDYPLVKKQKKLMKYYKIRNLYARSFLRMFENPDSIRYILNHRKQVKNGCYEPRTKEAGFMDDPAFLAQL